MKRIGSGLLVFLFCACSGGGGGSADGGGSGIGVVVNEVFPNGGTAMDPDWAELKNVGTKAANLSGYQVRDSDAGNLFRLPDGTTLAPGAYLVVFCDDQVDGGVVGGIHVPWKLSAKKGDQFHLVGPDGKDVDATTFAADLPGGKSWGRLPDGTGQFLPTSPTRGASNL